MRSDRVAPKIVGGKLVYEVRTDDMGLVQLPPDKVLHVKAVGDGLAGYSQIRLAREAIGAGSSAPPLRWKACRPSTARRSSCECGAAPVRGATR